MIVLSVVYYVDRKYKLKAVHFSQPNTLYIYSEEHNYWINALQDKISNIVNYEHSISCLYYELTPHKLSIPFRMISNDTRVPFLSSFLYVKTRSVIIEPFKCSTLKRGNLSKPQGLFITKPL